MDLFCLQNILSRTISIYFPDPGCHCLPRPSLYPSLWFLNYSHQSLTVSICQCLFLEITCLPLNSLSIISSLTFCIMTWHFRPLSLCSWVQYCHFGHVCSVNYFVISINALSHRCYHSGLLIK